MATAFNFNQQGAAQAIAALGLLAFTVGWIPVGVDAYRRGGRESTVASPPERIDPTKTSTAKP